MKLYRSGIKDVKSIAPKDIRVAIYGLGKMGLPLAAVFALKGFQVIGVDANTQVVEKVNSGLSPVVEEEGLESLVKKTVSKKKLRATTDGVEAARVSDVKVIIVPTFLDKKNNPDLEIVRHVAETIAQGLKKGDVVILESTAPPRTTLDVIGNILEKKSSLKLNKDFAVAHCPERTNSGTAIADIQGRINPKVVGASDKEALAIVEYIYEKINRRGVIPVKDTTTAELVKISEMVYRDVKIAYANSLALICDELGVDALDVISAANTDAECNILRPGPGVGGHCIPVYPYFLFDKVKKDTDLLKATRSINDRMSKFTIDLAKEALKEKGKDLKKASVLVLGFAYRGNVKETRLSPGIKIYRELQGKTGALYTFDPLFNKKETESFGMNYKDTFSGVDCIILATDHREFRSLQWKKIAQTMRTKTIVDGKNIIDFEKMKKLGFSIKRIGYAQ